MGDAFCGTVDRVGDEARHDRDGGGGVFLCRFLALLVRGLLALRVRSARPSGDDRASGC